ncbi:MAG: substrate-binding domain-containing protein [Treponema sp.]|jgi:inositol transport system substrate-binding protein|nr:substrate-binding domain-containing protein [Treponema sp.]
MKKALYVGVAVLLATAVFAGCTKKEAPGGTASAKSVAKIKIGYLNSNDNDTWLSYLKDEFIAYFADKPQYELLFENGQDDVVRQNDQVNSMIVNGVKALVVNPINTTAVGPITKAAADAGIPLVYVNRNPFSDGTLPPNVYYVGSDSIVGGRIQMEEMGKILGGHGEVCILMGRLDNEAAIERTVGNEQIIAEEFPDIKVLAKETGNWARDQGLDVTQKWLTAYPTLTAILSNNDEMALGAIEACRTAGRADVVVMGIDATPDAKAAIKDGRMAATVLQDAAGQGQGAAEYVHKVLNGEKPEPINWVPYVLINLENLSLFP